MEENQPITVSTPLEGQSGYASPDVTFSGLDSGGLTPNPSDQTLSTDLTNLFNNNSQLNNGGSMKISTKLATSWWTWAVVGAVLVGIALGGWYWSQKHTNVFTGNSSNSSSVAAESSILDFKESNLTNWSQYTSTDKGQKLSFQYDPSWKLSSKPSASEIAGFFDVNPGSQAGLSYDLMLANQTTYGVLSKLLVTRTTLTALPTNSPTVSSSQLVTRVVKVGDQNVTVNKIDAVDPADSHRSLSHNAVFISHGYYVNLSMTLNEAKAGYLTKANLENMQTCFDKLLGSLSIKE